MSVLTVCSMLSYILLIIASHPYYDAKTYLSHESHSFVHQPARMLRLSAAASIVDL